MAATGILQVCRTSLGARGGEEVSEEAVTRPCLPASLHQQVTDYTTIQKKSS